MRWKTVPSICFVVGALALIGLAAGPTTQVQLPPLPATPTLDLPPGVEPPTATPDLPPPPTSAAPGCENPLSLRPGQVVTLRAGVNIRSAPSPSAPWLANFDDFRLFTVIDGPVCVDGYVWWQLDGSRVRGWAAERSTSQLFILGADTGTPAPACPPPLNLPAGEQIELVTGVRVRLEPNLSGQVITVAPINAVATVLDPLAVCADGYNWRRVRVTVANFTYEGWMVEGSRAQPEQYFIDITLTPISEVCYPPLALQIGQLARVGYRDNTPKNLRAAPGPNADVLFTLVRGVPLEIIGGPVCANGMNYWRVRVLATTPVEGWLAEGARANRWIRPFVDEERGYLPP